ncbi:MAG: branched-chain amino acid ABC transporter permease [Pseudanabaena sp. ELA607]
MQILVNGLITGAIVAVMALAFTVVYLPTRIFYIALGGIYALAPFLVWTGLQWGWAWYVAVAAALVIAISLSLSCELLNHAWLEKKRAAGGTHLIASLGTYIVLVQTIAIIWGNETKVLRQGVDGVFNLSGVTLTQAQVGGAAIALLTMAGFYIWLQFSQLGLQFRAMADNSMELALRGYSIRNLRLVAFGIAGLLSAIASLLVAWDVGFDPQGGLAALLLAVVASIIGGHQSFFGAVLGGILLGVMRSQVVWFLSAQWQEAVTFMILAIFLLFRPQGLIGQKRRLEAEA